VKATKASTVKKSECCADEAKAKAASKTVNCDGDCEGQNPADCGTECDTTKAKPASTTKKAGCCDSKKTGAKG
jgi:hypothetical protein